MSIAPKAQPSVEQVLEQALLLPREQRLRLAEQLCEGEEEATWPDDVHVAWRDELTRRLATLRDGSARLIEGDEHLRRLKDKFGA